MYINTNELHNTYFFGYLKQNFDMTLPNVVIY